MVAISQEQWGDRGSLVLGHGDDVLSRSGAKSAENLSRASLGDLL